MNTVDPYWMALDYSTSDYRNDMRTSDAYLMRKNGGVVPAPFSQLDPTSNEFLGSGSKTDAFLPAGHRLILPAGGVLTILPPQDAPRTPNYNRNTTLDVFFLPAGTMAEYEVPYSYTLKSESNSQNAPIANEFYRTASPSPLEIVTLTVDLSDFAMPYHLPGLPTVNVGGSINVVIKDQVYDSDFANTNRFIEATVSLAAVKTRTMDKARLIEESVFSDVHQNIWIRIGGQIEVVENSGSTLILQPGTVINPVLGTYLPPSGDVSHERSEASRYVLNSPEEVQLAKTASFGRPALVIPAGIKVNTGQRKVRFTNVKGLIAHSPYPLEYEVECGLPDNDLGRNTIVQADEGVRATVLQTLAIVNGSFQLSRFAGWNGTSVRLAGSVRK